MIVCFNVYDVHLVIEKPHYCVEQGIVPGRVSQRRADSFFRDLVGSVKQKVSVRFERLV